MARKLLKFLIMFDNPNLLYFPGQFVSGRVLVELDEDTPVTDVASEKSSKKDADEKSSLSQQEKTPRTLGSAQVTGLYLHVVGEGVIKVSDRNRSATDKENYIDFRMRLLGEPGQGPVLLSPGIHSFPFKLGLPLGLPSTFLGKHGWVQYFCKAALREPNGLTHKNQQVFIVCNPIDLNLEPGILAQPFHCEMNPKLGMACLGQGEVRCRVRLDKGGYVPGETISIWANILNESKVTIKKTRACLSETIQYVAKSKVVQTESRELSSLSRGKIRPGEEEEWRGEHLYVPPLPPTNLRGCHIIRIQYDVFFILEPKSSEKEIKLQVPILLATYPFRNADGSLRRKQGTRYPSTLPILRPWLDEDKQSYLE